MNRNWTGVALAISVVINVFLVGAAVGILALGAHMAREHRPPGPGGGGLLWRASLALPPGEARAFRQAMRAQAQANRPLAEAGRRARHEAWLAAAGPTFDAAAVKAALARARALDQTARSRLEESLVDVAGALPAAQRQAVFRTLAEPPMAPRRMRMMHGALPPPGPGPDPSAPGDPGPGPDGPPPVP